MMKCTPNAGDTWLKYSQAEDQEQKRGEGATTHLAGKLQRIL